ncbi:MAG TPA: DEAD/DEAH box helicase [Deltaproteobacteria bacterium]|jgi:superfamily II DNA or RNA helicase|nr:DEAD/DEAH box helicase [Deltaproteobacteria bacterium]HRW81393.1 DEAD/DEAH box helicase [Desulfomonilia bacterium]HOC76897.1 DEAD/DEAH box helicase [Deltaproteobacteria bacterium]HON95749.1 DEAD/DEAH box helicase [Deltaproteobacteria bacterium]HOY75951.1 DEAD/DEAH box helicase [Deltaproteobacteria bacterium]
MNILVHVDNLIRILEADLPEAVVQAIEADLTLPNPKWEQVETYSRSRRRNFQPEFIRYYKRKSGVLLMPRGYIHTLRHRLGTVPFTIVDKTRTRDPVDFGFRARLHPYQAAALRDIASRRFGVLEAPPGAGKTVIALSAIGLRKQPALVIVHTKELLYQWQKRACEFLDMRSDEVGLIGDGHRRIGERLTVALINSLYRAIDEVRPAVGHLVVDECHHVPARTFTDAVGLFDSTYMLGLSATPYRRDKLTRIIYFYLGDRVHEIRPTELQAMKRIMRARLIVRHTNCAFFFDADEYQYMISALVADAKRNRLIVDDVAARAGETDKGIALVISDRVSHCEELFRAICAQGVRACLLTGSVPVRDRARIVEELNCNQAQVLVATAQLIGEGFDLKQLSSIFLATPIKFTGRVKQYIGRILRISEGKEEAVIYDYLDVNGMLKNSFSSRMSAYHDLGVKLEGTGE